MFELFAQGDRSLARSEGGLGIGLTVVKKLVELHGGSVAARSEGPGKGMRIHGPAPGGAAPRRGGAGPEQPPDRRRDDRRGSSWSTTTWTRPRAWPDCSSSSATRSGRPTTAAKPSRSRGARRPEFVLLDIGLPEMDGYEVARRLRQEEGCRDAVIVAVSGYGQEEDVALGRVAGFDHHLVKPIDHDALLLILSGA